MATPPDEVRLETERLLLRPWRVEEASIHRALWSERDSRIPARRRIDAEGRPSVEDLAAWARAHTPSTTGLLAIERRTEGDVIGYCGLVDSDQDPREPELAFELLRRTWGQGYATEAAWAVLDWARSSGFERVWASVWSWNIPSRKVLAKLGFTETDLSTRVPPHGTNLLAVRTL